MVIRKYTVYSWSYLFVFHFGEYLPLEPTYLGFFTSVEVFDISERMKTLFFNHAFELSSYVFYHFPKFAPICQLFLTPITNKKTQNKFLVLSGCLFQPNLLLSGILMLVNLFVLTQCSGGSRIYRSRGTNLCIFSENLRN